MALVVLGGLDLLLVEVVEEVELAVFGILVVVTARLATPGRENQRLFLLAARDFVLMEVRGLARGA